MTRGVNKPPCAVHGSDPGGGYPPPPALPQVLHACCMGGAQWQATGHIGVRQGRVEEMEATAVGRGVEEHSGVLSGLHETFGGGF